MHSKYLQIFLIIFNLSKSDASSGSIITKLNTDTDLELITDHIIMEELRREGIKCFTIICDTIYLNVFEGPLFKRLFQIPYIMIVVEEYEDLLSPNFDTLEGMRQARRDSCDIYVIYLANGIQTSRLLMFGDRYREIDTRAKFLILHDFRLFRTEMHYIWKRIVNVVFIRHHGNTPGSVNSWFDLTTVPFPSPIQGVLVPRRIDTWRKGKFYKGFRLFSDKTADLKGQSLSVVYLDHVPAVSVAETSDNSSRIDGLEIQILNTLAEKMNFKSKFYTPENVKLHQWGQQQLNGTFSGLLGEMVNGKADLGVGNLQYNPYHLHLTDLTIPYISQCFTFLTPEALTDNSWKTLIMPFKLYMWIGVLLVLFVTGLIFYVLAIYYTKLANLLEENNLNGSNKQVKKATGLYLFGELINSILYTYGMLLVVSLPKLPTGWSIRLLTGWYWLYCILLVVSYKASMTAILANPAPTVTIDTLQELIESKIKCGGWGTETKNFFLTSNDEYSRTIGQKLEFVNDPDEATSRVANGEFAYYENAYFLKYLAVKRQAMIVNNLDITAQLDNETAATNETKTIVRNKVEGNLHVMKDCVVNMPISIGLQKNSPLKPRADKYLRQIIEVGLVEKWLNNALQKVRSSDVNVVESVKALMNLQKLYGGFVALGIGYFLSTICLICEILYWNFVVKKDPRYDKYTMDLYYSKKK